MSLVGRTLDRIRREGLLAALECAWARLWEAVAGWRLSTLLGRLRNCWRLPGLRRRAMGGKLNLGCGPDRRPGWTNADLGLTGDLHLDVTRRFPFAGDSFAVVFSEHLLEHLSEAGAANCLRECYRVLQPGGYLRLSTPDLAHLAGVYQAPAAQTAPARAFSASLAPWKYPPGTVATPAQLLNDAFYLWEHRHLWDEADLRALLVAIGFADVTRFTAGVGGSELTSGLEHRPEAAALILEARKPG